MGTKHDIKTEKFTMPKGNWQVTSVLGKTRTFADMTYGEMVTQVVDWLTDEGLTFPLGLMSDGIKEVENV